MVGGWRRRKGSRIMRKTSLILLGAAAGVAMTLLAVQPRIMMGASAKAAVADTYRQLNLFGDVFERVRADYVEKPDDSKLIETAINGMLAGLDPHSSYMDAKSFKDMQVQTRGEFGGLGIEVTMEDGLIKVVAPIDETRRALRRAADLRHRHFRAHPQSRHRYHDVAVSDRDQGRRPG